MGRSHHGSCDNIKGREVQVLLGVLIEKKGDIDEDINQCIRVGWKKWISASRVLFDKNIPAGSKGMVYHMVVMPALLYIWFKVLTNQETSSPEVDGSRDENDMMDVWIYEIR